MSRQAIKPLLKNPFDPPEKVEFTIPGEISRATGPYEVAMKEGYDLIQRPIKSVSIDQIEKQHFKKRMTVWERLKVLSNKAPNILFQNWGKNLDGASLVTAILNIGGVANITLIDREGRITAFDTGPGNGLIDSWVEHCGLGRFDDGGRLASAGRRQAQRSAAAGRAAFGAVLALIGAVILVGLDHRIEAAFIANMPDWLTAFATQL